MPAALVVGFLIGYFVYLYFFETEKSSQVVETADSAVTNSKLENIAWKLPEAEINKDISILALGDLMMDRNVRGAINENSPDYPFIKISDFLKGNDLILVNLEGPFTDLSSKSLGNHGMIFTFDPAMIPFLKNFGFNLFDLANNHTLNFGQKGLDQTKKYLSDSGLDYFGDPFNKNGISLVKEISGIRIGFIGYDELDSPAIETVLAEIKNLRPQADFLIVYSHWGVEYITMFSKSQQAKARQFIDAGADLVIGSHPHVIQPLEVYKNKIIFYSLGNFLFDQNFSVQTSQGLAVKIIFEKSKTSYSFFPFDIKNAQVSLMEKEKSDDLLEDLSKQSQADQGIKDQIKQGRVILENLWIYQN